LFAKPNLDVQQNGLNGMSDLIAQDSVTKFIAVIVINLVKPKNAAKLKLLFNELASGPRTRSGKLAVGPLHSARRFINCFA